MSFKRQVYEDHINITDQKFNVDYYQNFDDEKKYDLLYALGSEYGKLPKNKRKALIFGFPDIKYEVSYRGKTNIRNTIDWTQIPLITEIRDKLMKTIQIEPTVCIYQWYPNGKISIDAHRDKEMKAGTRIAGVSYGSTRNLSFSNGMGSIKFELHPGSLYVMNPPTNDSWSHAIIRSECTEPRISLTFRDY
jgi:alkylated DNA repair dioxygenase AlkB